MESMQQPRQVTQAGSQDVEPQVILVPSFLLDPRPSLMFLGLSWYQHEKASILHLVYTAHQTRR